MSDAYSSNNGAAPPTGVAQALPGNAVPGGAYRLTLIQVTSILVVSFRQTKTQVGTVEELQRFSKSVMIHNLLLGWWGIPFGLIWNIMALVKNSRALGKLKQLSGGGVAPAAAGQATTAQIYTPSPALPRSSHRLPPPTRSPRWPRRPPRLRRPPQRWRRPGGIPIHPV